MAEEGAVWPSTRDQRELARPSSLVMKEAVDSALDEAKKAAPLRGDFPAIGTSSLPALASEPGIRTNPAGGHPKPNPWGHV